MQFRSLGRLRVMRRMEGVGKEICESLTVGGGVVKVDVDILGSAEAREWGRVLKTRTGQAVWERV